MKDFTLDTYIKLIKALLSSKKNFLTIREYFSYNAIDTPLSSLVLMRHDVDRKPENALHMAELEHDLGVKATYYFRTISKTLKPEIIKKIADLGHEIGYHYENLSTAQSMVRKKKYKTGKKEEKTDQLFKLAITDFENNLKSLRNIVPINTICMHGKPLSKWDSRKLWEKYDYKKYKIFSEPYLDINFNKVQYITDAGRSWNNTGINLRDKVVTPFQNNFNHTEKIIKSLNHNQLSNRIMFNIHPEHWSNSSLEWYKIWIIRKCKNSAKKIFLEIRK